MFSQKCFSVFSIDGLENRMIAIRNEIQPQFQEIGEILREEVANSIQKDCYLHIAQHRRRTTHAPENTWCAISTQKRGYKMAPHFQLGIWKDYVFIYLSIIDQPQKQDEIAKFLIDNPHLLEDLPKNFVFSKDHTVARFYPLDNELLPQAIERLTKVKKSEFEIGKVYSSTLFNSTSKNELINDFIMTIRQLLPIYQLLINL